MTGFEAISAHNGWAIAAIGISIVFTGLTLLSIIISQLHKVLEYIEARGKSHGGRASKDDSEIIIVIPKEVRQAARQYRMIVDRIGEPFALPRLLELASRHGLEKPHSTINSLIKKQVILPDGEGYFTWNEKAS